MVNDEWLETNLDEAGVVSTYKNLMKIGNKYYSYCYSTGLRECHYFNHNVAIKPIIIIITIMYVEC